MIAKKLVEHCSPTLSGMKTANLFMFNMKNVSGQRLEAAVTAWNKKLNPKGVTLKIFCKCEKRALIYVYRETKLKAIFQNPGIREFLAGHGYREFGLEYCLARLQKRVQENPSFPHEIGLFLDYPLEDVEGFIKYGGKNAKYSGFWQVYGDEKEAVKLFSKYQKCREVYTRIYGNRIRSIYQLTVAA